MSLLQIVERGHSRIPVYESNRENIVGLLMAKRLIPINPDDDVPVKEICKSKQSLLSVYMKDPLFNLLNKFQTGKSKFNFAQWCCEEEEMILLTHRWELLQHRPQA